MFSVFSNYLFCFFLVPCARLNRLTVRFEHTLTYPVVSYRVLGWRYLDQFERRGPVGSESCILQRRRRYEANCRSASRRTTRSSPTGDSRPDMAPCSAQCSVGWSHHHTNDRLPRSASHIHTTQLRPAPPRRNRSVDDRRKLT